jgi:hypothetical protein
LAPDLHLDLPALRAAAPSGPRHELAPSFPRLPVNDLSPSRFLSLSVLTMPILAGIFSKKDKNTRHKPPSNSSFFAPAAALSAGTSTLRVVDDGHKGPAPAPRTVTTSISTDYVLPEISLFSAENGAVDDTISITASSSSAHPPSSSGNLYNQPIASSSSSKLRLINPFRKKIPQRRQSDSQCSH